MAGGARRSAFPGTDATADGPSEEDPGAAQRAGQSIMRATSRLQRRIHPILKTRPFRTFSHFTDVGGSVLSGGMSYQALFAVFAALWVGFGVFGIVLRNNTELLDAMVSQINVFIPGLIEVNGAEGAVKLDALFDNRTLDWTSIVAGLTLIWVALNWFTGTRRSIRIIFGLDVKQYRNAALLKLRDLLLALIFAVAIVVSAGLAVFGTDVMSGLFEFLGWNQNSWLLGGLGKTVGLAAMYVFDVLVLMAMHRLLAEVRVPLGALLRGCALGGIGLFVLKLGGTLFLGGASSNPLLASFAVLIVLLIWFNLICRVLLLTASWIAVGQDRSLGQPPPLTED